MDGVRTAADEGPAAGIERQRAGVARAEQRFADRPTRRHLPESQAVGPDREHGTVGAARETVAEAVDTARQRLADPAPRRRSRLRRVSRSPSERSSSSERPRTRAATPKAGPGRPAGSRSLPGGNTQ
ncbi:hypothetical protein SLI_6278 [Streptomyces lividans 1326]|uniref:Uncharacterized protein n=1 Tax=Streptomyces lividans 1326 TaxID=1200984 RepID=A0A7U9DXH6_STRLI|nr:hypothetical protein SLI_6278 [Streptomyces lividans 1326]